MSHRLCIIILQFCNNLYTVSLNCPQFLTLGLLPLPCRSSRLTITPYWTGAMQNGWPYIHSSIFLPLIPLCLTGRGLEPILTYKGRATLRTGCLGHIRVCYINIGNSSCLIYCTLFALISSWIIQVVMSQTGNLVGNRLFITVTRLTNKINWGEHALRYEC